jgi:hypothetical protein
MSGMNPYKVGDRVKYLGTETIEWNGLVGTVTEVWEQKQGDDYRVNVRFDGQQIGARGSLPSPYIRNLMPLGESEFEVDL